MLQTPQKPASYKQASTAVLPQPSFEQAGRQIKQYSSFPALQAKYSGSKNFSRYCIGPGAHLEGANLANADLRWSNFRGTTLINADLSASTLWGSTLTNAKLCGADLRKADFTGADLSGADLSEAKTEGACFMGARYSAETVFPDDFGCPEKRGMVSQDGSLQLC